MDIRCDGTPPHPIQPHDSRGLRERRTPRREAGSGFAHSREQRGTRHGGQLARRGSAARATGPLRSTTTEHHPHAEICEPVGREGAFMNSIVYVVGAVVIIGVVLKMLGVY